MSIDWHLSTMEQRLAAGIRDLCILLSQNAFLEGNEKKTLTSEVLCLLLTAPKTTRCREEWIK